MLPARRLESARRAASGATITDRSGRCSHQFNIYLVDHERRV